MKKTLLLLLVLLGFGANAQITLFQDSFDTYADFAITNVGSWTLIDVDGKSTYIFGDGITFPNEGIAKSFQVFNDAETSPPLAASATSNWTARTGAKSMVCFSASNPAPLINNDWLISPQVTLGATDNVLTFWAKSCDTNFGLEKFRVGISSGNTTTGVTLLSAGIITTPANITWVEYTYNVPSSFNGQAVYFSINCVSDDQFGFAVDDFRVTTTSLNTTNFFKNNFSIYPNPANNIVTISKNNTAEISSMNITDINGRIVKEVTTGLTTINVSDLNTGVYFLKVISNEGIGTTKFIKN